MNQNILIKKLQESADEFMSADSPKQLYSAIVKHAMNITGADYGMFFLYDVGTIQKAYSSSPILNVIKKSYIQSCFKSQKSIQVKKLAKNQPELIQKGIGCEVFIPLSAKDEVLGALLLYSRDEDVFTDSLINFLQLFSAITALSLAKEHLREESKKALETRDHFISLSSHELRTPLTSINGYIQLLHTKMNKQNTQESRWVEALHAESTRMTSLVKELLDVNRIKQGQFAFIFSHVSLYEVITKAINKHDLTHPDHKILFKNEITDNNYNIIGDFDKLTEMVSGLLSNAVKFSKPDADIIVRFTRTSRTISITVQSFGRAITKQDLAAIFEGFYKTKHPGIEGMGVGLFLAKNIVTHHRGKINITSKETKGTTVEVTLPSKKI